jgi:hypothetical protein
VAIAGPDIHLSLQHLAGLSRRRTFWVRSPFTNERYRSHIVEINPVQCNRSESIILSSRIESCVSTRGRLMWVRREWLPQR